MFRDADKQDYTVIKTKIAAGSTAIALIGTRPMAPPLSGIQFPLLLEVPNLKWYFGEFDQIVVANISNNAKIEGFKGTDPLSASPYLADFKARYKTKYGKDPASYDSRAYDAGMMVALAMVKGQANTSDAIKANIIPISNGTVKQTGSGVAGYSDAVANGGRTGPGL